MTRARASRRYRRWLRYVNRYPWWRRSDGYHRARHAAIRHRPDPQWAKMQRRVSRRLAGPDGSLIMFDAP